VPVYEYGCTKCKREFEYQQRMSDPPMKKCEACGGKLERLISRTSFQLKGGGWYKDLYASAKSSDAGGGDGGASASTDAKPAASDAKPAASESKPAAKPATDAAPAKKKAKPSSKGK
jgi:putative FmdB family regulatory protein